MSIRNRLVAWLLPLLLVGPILSIALNMWFHDELGPVVSQLDDIGEQVVNNAHEISESVKEDFRKELIASHENNADHIKLYLNQEIISHQRVLETLSALPSLSVWISANNSEDNFLKNSIADHFQQVVEHCGLGEISILDRDGNEKIRVAAQYVKPGGDPIFDGVPLGNSDTNESQNAWFQAFVASNKPTFVYAMISRDYPVETPVIVICKQLRLRENILGTDLKSADGIIKLTIPLNHIAKNLEESEQALAANHVCMIDSLNRLILFDSRKKNSIGPVLFKEPVNTLIIKRETAVENLQCYLLIDESVFALGSDRSEALTKSLLSKTGSGKKLVDEIGGQLSFNNTLVLVLSAIVAVCFSIMVMFISRTFTRPIKMLNKAARQIAKGDLLHAITTKSRDEIGQLAEDFNLMRMKLATQLQELKDSNAGMEAAMRIKSSFMANMSHEIRTPLNGMLGMAELLCETDLDQYQKEQLEIIRTSGQDLLTVINDILDYSKIESNNMEVERRPFDVWSLAKDIMSLFAGKANNKGLNFNLYVDPRIQYELIGDAHRIKQVINNLISNALKFTARGMVFFRIELTKRLDDETSLVKFSVIDSGIGIEAESQSRVFDSFSQEDVSTTRRFGGTGLGLTISKKLTALMGGDLQLESTPGVGSTFSFEIPFHTGVDLKHISQIDEIQGDVVLVCGLDPLSEKIIGQYTTYLKLSYIACADASDLKAALEKCTASDQKVCLLIVDLQLSNASELFEQYKKYHCIGIDTFDKVTPNRLQELHLDRALTKPIDYKKYKHELAIRADHPAEDRAQTGSEPQLHGLADKRLLLAEDNRVNQKVVFGYLKSIGLTVDVAENGLEAIKLLEEHHYDLVLMDCHMPEMDGYEATTMIRRNEEGSDEHIPIVALTANAMSGDREKCLQIGMDDYLSKPLKKDLLYKTLDKWLNT